MPRVPATRAQPWSCKRMERHIQQRIRERADISIGMHQDDDGEYFACLNEGAERRIWGVILDALYEAGWYLTPNGEPSDDET